MRSYEYPSLLGLTFKPFFKTFFIYLFMYLFLLLFFFFFFFQKIVDASVLYRPINGKIG
jgi:hypothetical protein